MMKVFWVGAFLLAVTYTGKICLLALLISKVFQKLLLSFFVLASSKTINCYVCEEYIDDSSVQKLFDFQNLIEMCADPITNSTTEKVDSDKFNCAKIDLKSR